MQEAKEEIMNKWQSCFKEELNPQDRMKVEPVKLRLKDEEARPTFCTPLYDTPFNLREIYEKEIKISLDAGHIVPCGTEPSEWDSKVFRIPKGDGTSVLSCRTSRGSIITSRGLFRQLKVPVNYYNTSILVLNVLYQWT